MIQSLTMMTQNKNKIEIEIEIDEANTVGGTTNNVAKHAISSNTKQNCWVWSRSQFPASKGKQQSQTQMQMQMQNQNISQQEDDSSVRDE